MASGYKISDGTDLDLIFKARGSASPSSSVGIIVANGDGYQGDISGRYYPSSGPGDRIASPTGFKNSAGTDLQNIYRDYDYPDGPTITAQPSNDTENAGGTLSFSVTATTSGGTLLYQWQKYNGSTWDDLTNGGDISGATSSTLSIANCEVADNGTYRCEVSDDNGTTASSNASAIVYHLTFDYLTVDGNTVTNLEVFNKTAGDVVSCQIVFSYAPGISYQWQIWNGSTYVNMSNGGNISGVTTNTLTFNTITVGDSNYYVCYVTNTNGLTNDGIGVYEFELVVT